MTDTTEGPYADDPQSESAREKQTVTNDAVAGDTVEPVDSFAGPNGAEKAEAEPTYSPRDDLDPDDIVLREVDDPSEDGSPDIARES
jgi:hypothetical protein